MRLIEGFVCLARINDLVRQERLFGPNTGDSDFNHQTFTSNGLIPFGSTAQAIETLDGIRRRKEVLGTTRTGLARIRMEMATSDQEFKVLYEKGELIVIAGQEGRSLLLGKKIKGVPYGAAYAPVSDLELNGFKVFKKAIVRGRNVVDSALYEVRRQGRPISSTLSTFLLERLKA